MCAGFRKQANKQKLTAEATYYSPNGLYNSPGPIWRKICNWGGDKNSKHMD